MGLRSIGWLMRRQGNTPPWMNPVKAKYGNFDGERAKKYFGATKLKTPSFFPIVSLLPQRCMTYIKSRFHTALYETAFQELWIAMWEQQLDLSDPANMSVVLAKHFSVEETEEIMGKAGEKEWKQALLQQTQRALEKGAFGAPWFWVRNVKGLEEPFFGSDRFHYMFEFLELPWSDIELKAKI